MAEFYRLHPEEKIQMDAINLQIKDLQAKGLLKINKNEIYEIPIVVHVVGDGSSVGSQGNKSDQQIRDWIEYTNKVFAGTADNVGATIPIRLVFAKITPDGKRSNGINRVDLSGNGDYKSNGVNSVDSFPGISENELKQAVPVWNDKKYYNIYVVKDLKQGDVKLNGYAYFPSSYGPDLTVMNSSAASAGSQTMPHEFGHAMGLYHTFGGDSTGCTGDDLVDDTEKIKNLLDDNRKCYTGTVNECTGVNYAGGEQNIMSYTYCFRNRFTAGQRDRAIYLFKLYNSNLINSDADVPPRVYIKPGANGDGSSWDNPADLVEILKWGHENQNNGYWDANNPLQIWVAKGKYVPRHRYGGGADRDRTFVVVRDIQMYGGFNGNETSLHQRRPYYNESLLDGENTVSHVMVSTADVGKALVDGFTLFRGNANDKENMKINGENVNMDFGGAIFINKSSPVFRNLVIKDNRALHRGGGVYICNHSKPVFQNTVFINNQAGQDNGDGGAIYTYDNNTMLTLLNCTLVNNGANDGGAIRFDSNIDVLIANSIFYNNSSKNGANTLNQELSFNFNVNDFTNRNQTKIDSNIFQYYEKGYWTIRQDPKMVSNEFYVQNGSPAINTGNNGYNIPPTGYIDHVLMDAVGLNRLVQGTIDRGAWEMQCSLPEPIANNSTYSFCFVPKVSDLNAEINGQYILKVYQNSTDYDPLDVSAKLSQGTYYVSRATEDGCTSGRVAVNVVVNSPPAAPSGFQSPSQITCEGRLKLSDITATNGVNLKWYDASTNGNLLPLTTVVKSGVYYYASQTINSCESPRTGYRKTLNLPPGAPTGNLTQTFNEGANISSLVMNTTAIRWFNTSQDALNNENALNLNTLLETKKYYAVQLSAAGCTSTPTEVNVIVNISNSPATHLGFDGTNDYVNVGNSQSVQISGDKITLEALIRPRAFRENRWEGSIINKEEYVGEKGYGLRVGGNGQVSFNIGIDGWQEIFTGDNAVSLNTWSHIAATYDGTMMKVFVNGVEKASKNVTGSIKNSARNLYIGNNFDENRGFTGDIEEVRIWNTARTATDLIENRSCELSGNESGLVTYYQFNQGIGFANNTTVKTVTDKTSFGNHGILNNFTLTGSNSNWLSKSLVNVSPEITAQPQDQIITGTSELNFSVEATGGSSYQWQISGDNELNWQDLSDSMTLPDVSGSKTNHLTISGGNLMDMNGKKFRVIVTSLAGCKVYSNAASASVTLKVLENNSKKAVIYPNPSNGIFYLETASNPVVEIYDNAGRLIKKLSVKQGKSEIDITEKVSGMYIIKVIDSEKKVATSKLIKK